MGKLVYKKLTRLLEFQFPTILVMEQNDKSSQLLFPRTFYDPNRSWRSKVFQTHYSQIFGQLGKPLVISTTQYIFLLDFPRLQFPTTIDGTKCHVWKQLFFLPTYFLRIKPSVRETKCQVGSQQTCLLYLR